MEASSSSLSTPLLYFGRDRFMRKWVEEENTLLLLFSTLPVAQTDREEEGKEPNASVSPAQFLKKSFFSFRKKNLFFLVQSHQTFLFPAPHTKRRENERKGERERMEKRTFSRLRLCHNQNWMRCLFFCSHSTHPLSHILLQWKWACQGRKDFFKPRMSVTHHSLSLRFKIRELRHFLARKNSEKRYKLARICQDRQFRRQKTQRKQKKYSAPHNQENGLTKPFPPCSLSLSMHAKQAAPFLNPHDLSEPLPFSPCVSN